MTAHDNHLLSERDRQDREDAAYDAVQDDDQAMDAIFRTIVLDYADWSPVQFVAAIYAGDFLALDDRVRAAIQAEADRLQAEKRFDSATNGGF